MNSHWRQFGVSLLYLRRSLNFIIGMLHFMESLNPRMWIRTMVMVRKASPVKMEEMDQGKYQNNFADVSNFLNLMEWRN
jgi:hypothetical protein